MYTIVVHRRAARYLKKLSQDQQTRIKQVLNQMKTDPLGLSGILARVYAGRPIPASGNTRSDGQHAPLSSGADALADPIPL